jgi:DNA-binding Lrp family transcriptional regulator
MAEHVEVAFCAAISGSSNLTASVVCSGVTELYDYLTEKVAKLPGVQGAETAPVIRTVKSISAGRIP